MNNNVILIPAIAGALAFSAFALGQATAQPETVEVVRKVETKVVPPECLAALDAADGNAKATLLLLDIFHKHFQDDQVGITAVSEANVDGINTYTNAITATVRDLEEFNDSIDINGFVQNAVACRTAANS